MKNEQYEEEMPDFAKIVNDLPKDSKIFVDKSMEISNRIADTLKEKNILQKDLALMLNKSEAEVSKFLSGSHNYTLRTLSKIEAVLNCDIIKVSRNIYTSCSLPEVVRSHRPDLAVLKTANDKHYTWREARIERCSPTDNNFDDSDIKHAA